jgi:hypothetical protein
MQEPTLRQRLLARMEALNKAYSPWQDTYKSVRDHILPWSGWFLHDSEDSYNPTQHDKRYNYEVTRAARIFGAGMKYGTCRPSAPWFQLTLHDADLARFRPVRDWLDQVEEIYRVIFAKSNFYEAQQNGFVDQGTFGKTFLLPERINEFPFVFWYRWPVGSYRVAVDQYGQAEAVYRPIKMKYIELANRFGKEKLSTTAQRALESNPYGWCDVVQVIEPRDDRDRTKIDTINMPIRSVWMEKTHEKQDALLEHSGFPYFPGVYARYMQVDGQPYGVGPGIDALNRIRMLNEMEKTSLLALHQEADPAMIAPSRLDGILDTNPGAITFDSGVTEGKPAQVYPILSRSTNWQWLQSRLDAIEGSVDKAYMVDLFLMIMQSGEDPRRTATEILKRWEEKMTILGPVTEHQQRNNFDPNFDRVWSILTEIDGLIPPPPEEIVNMNLKIEYTGILAQAQKLTEVDKMNTFIDMGERVAALDPSVVHAVDGFAIMQKTDEAIGLPVSILRDRREYEERVATQQQAEAQAMQLAAAEQGSNVAKNLGVQVQQ